MYSTDWVWVNRYDCHKPYYEQKPITLKFVRFTSSKITEKILNKIKLLQSFLGKYQNTTNYAEHMIVSNGQYDLAGVVSLVNKQKELINKHDLSGLL